MILININYGIVINNGIVFNIIVIKRWEEIMKKVDGNYKNSAKIILLIASLFLVCTILTGCSSQNSGVSDTIC